MMQKCFFLAWCTLVAQGAIGMDGAGPASTGPKTLKEYAAARCARLEIGLRPTDTIPQELIEVLQEHPVNFLQQWGESFLRACSRAPEGANVSSVEQIGEIYTFFSQLNVLLNDSEQKVLERLARVHRVIREIKIGTGWYAYPLFLKRDANNLHLIKTVFLENPLRESFSRDDDMSKLLQMVLGNLDDRLKFTKNNNKIRFQQGPFIDAVNQLATTFAECARKSAPLRTLLSHRVDFLREIVAMNAIVCNGQEVPEDRIQRTPRAYIVAGGIRLPTMQDTTQQSLRDEFLELSSVPRHCIAGENVFLRKILLSNPQNPVYTLNAVLSYIKLLKKISTWGNFYNFERWAFLCEPHGEYFLSYNHDVLTLALLPIPDNLTKIIDAIDTRRVNSEEEPIQSRIRLLCGLLTKDLLPRLHQLNNALPNKDCTELLERIERLNTILSRLAGDDREWGWWTKVVINPLRYYCRLYVTNCEGRLPFVGRPAGRK